jgi:2-methylcitrate dehydratase PrpD
MTAAEAREAVADVVGPLLERAVPPEAYRTARARLADTVFAALVGAGTQQGRAGAALAADLYGPADSLAGSLFRTVAAVRMTEIDDIDLLSCTTPGSVVVPTVLALVAHCPAVVSGERGAMEMALDAVIRGYDLVTGLGEAIDGPRRLAGGVWPTLAVAPVAACAIAGLLLGFDRARLERAIALAEPAVQTGNPRGNARETTLAAAVVAGVGAALAARRGFAVETGGHDGPLAALLRADAAEHGHGQSQIGRPAIKRFCSARQVMTAVCAVRAMAGDGLDAAAIDRIVVEVPSAYARMIDKPTVASRRESLASAHYQLAAAVTEPRRLLDVDRADLRLSPELRAAMARISVRAAPDLDRDYPRHWPARVRISAGGIERDAQYDTVPGEGDCGVPALRDKFAAFLGVSDGLDERLADEVLDRGTRGTGRDDLLALAGLLHPAPRERRTYDRCQSQRITA